MCRHRKLLSRQSRLPHPARLRPQQEQSPPNQLQRWTDYDSWIRTLPRTISTLCGSRTTEFIDYWNLLQPDSRSTIQSTWTFAQLFVEIVDNQLTAGNRHRKSPLNSDFSVNSAEL